MKKIEYLIKPENKVVVGVIDKEDCKNVEGEIVDELRHGRMGIVQCIVAKKILSDGVQDIDDIFEDTHFIRGVAKCDEKDVFDEKIGKAIVGTKINYKYHDLMSRKYNQMIRIFQEVIDDLKRLRDRHIVSRDKCDLKLAKYL